jgi:hypothetical protein
VLLSSERLGRCSGLLEMQGLLRENLHNLKEKSPLKRGLAVTGYALK